MTKQNVSERLFQEFKHKLEREGLIMNEGIIIDASFVVVPTRRNSREEKRQIKEGKGKELWKEEKNKKRQKDIDAQWVMKGNKANYGYKAHVKIDEKSKFY